MSDFDEIRDARTLEGLTEARDALEARWQQLQPLLFEYVDAKLSSEHLWASVYIDRFPHLGSRTTSRAEGAHATMKAYIHSRHGNLWSVTKALMNHFTTQHVNIENELAADLHKVPLDVYTNSFFIELSRNVSRHALRLLRRQEELAQFLISQSRKNAEDTAMPTCDASCCIQPTMGLPCCHQMVQWKARGEPIPLSAIHPHWRTSKGLTSEKIVRMLDPLDPQQRKIGAAATKTGRLLTAAEIATATRKKATRRCRNCAQTGHNCSQCPEPCLRCKSKEHRYNQCTI